MAQARVRLSTARFARTASGSVTGDVWVELDGIAFPEAEWNDFAVPVLSAWCEACLRLVRNDPSTILVHFMDGPYTVELRRSGESWAAISLTRSTIEGSEIEHAGDIDVGPLVESVLKCSEQAMSACRARSWEGDDIDALAAAIASLRQSAIRLAL